MDMQNLFWCCKKGDLEGIRYLVEQRDVDVNCRDNWDSTPLYYACLCGHLTVVQYLIDVGARCEANTFDGERCLYGALTDDIRRALTQHRLITSRTIRRDAYEEFLRRLYEKGEYSDVTFVVHGKNFRLHRCILVPRSPYFCDMFTSRWRQRRRIVINSDLVSSDAFDAVMRYIYTGRFECSLDLVDNCVRIATNCKLPRFKELTEEALNKALFLQAGKCGRIRVTRVVVERDGPGCQRSEAIGADLRDLVQSTLPPELRVWPTEMPFCQTEQPSFFDVCFMVEGRPFMCHKAFFGPQSDYFTALFEDHFQEVTWSGGALEDIPVISLHGVTLEVFKSLILFLYCNQTSITEENATDVLMTADMCLLGRLKKQCGVFLSQKLSIENVLEVHKLARLFSLPRLEDQCVYYMAKHFDQIVHQEALQEVITADAQEVKGRQETDTVTIVDEIRYHISSNLHTMSDMQEAHAKLSLLEDLLDDLGIDA